MNKHIIILLLFLFGSYITYSQSSGSNFVRETVYKVSGGNLSDPRETQSTITYLDGLGRPVQSVAVFAGGQGQDIVSHITYDEFGREQKKYSPYPVAGNNGSFRALDPNEVVTNLGDGKDKAPFSLTVYEPSPLNRVVKQGGPGSAWGVTDLPTQFGDHSVKIKYSANEANSIKRFDAFNSDGKNRNINSPFVDGGGLDYVGFYGEGQLWVTETLDENNTTTFGGNRTQEFKDKSGRVILKRSFSGSDNVQFDTYYIYDDLGQLRAVFPPLLSKSLITTAGDEFTGADLTNIKELAFLYCYDTQGRMIYKKVPGAESVTLSYDAKDRLINSQDGVQRTVDKSNYTTYDNLNRVIETGIQTDATNKEWLVKTFYDGLSDAGWLSGGTSDYPIDLTVKLGMVTGGQTRMIKSDGSFAAEEQALANRVYYDKRSRVVKTYKEYTDALGSKTTETVMMNRSYIGTVLEDKTEQSNSINKLTITQSYQYDHAERLLTTCHRILETVGQKSREEIPHLINSLSYDGLGRLERKSMGRLPDKYLKQNPSFEYAETQYYRYNIRNWLTETTAYRLLEKANYGAPSAEKQNFSLSLSYEKGGQYNGNIAEYDWKTGKYKLAYDGVNRLVSAIDDTKNAYYNEELSYDLNGNITKLKRTHNVNATTVELSDDLTYTYGNGGMSNRLMRVDDGGETVAYSNLNNTTIDDFAYDNNGNLTQDKDKGITSIGYNVLNLVSKVSGGIAGKAQGIVQDYTWDGSGVKLSYSSSGGAGSVKKVYVGVVEYTSSASNQLSVNRIATSEGHVLKREGWVEGSIESKYVYYYDVKDHLGNVRIVVDDEQNAQVWQNNSYSAFGLTIFGAGDGLSDVNAKKANDRYYNGKEAQDVVGWYDFGARMYNPEIGRWMNIDPMTEKHLAESVFSFSGNNPIINIDPDGRDWFRHDDTGALIWRDSQVGNISVNNQTYNNVGATYAWTSSISDGNGGTQTVLNIGATDGTSTLITPNENDVVQFPESGNGFARYTNGLVDTYQLNGVSGQWGDNWVKPSTAASLYNAIQQFHKQEPGVIVHYGDISAYDPTINIGHNTHTQGNAIDIRYIGASGQELTGNKAYSNADVCLTNCFMSIAESHGFSNNYTYGNRFTHSGDNNNGVHKDHLHIAKPNRRR